MESEQKDLQADLLIMVDAAEKEYNNTTSDKIPDE